MKRSVTTILTCLALVLLSAGPVDASATGDADRGGIQITWTKAELARASMGQDPATGKPDKRSFAYISAVDCQLSTPGGSSADTLCAAAVAACAGNTPAQGQGPQVRVYRRELKTDGSPKSGWVQVGTTCYPELVPGKPVLVARILKAFHNTPWAVPAVHIQPEGNTTLVTLPTYFEVRWPPAGFQPGEINTTTLLGSSVRIRPTAQSYTYDFGDGTSFGPTDSAGGTYPDGDITHAYPKAGTYATQINITYGGQYSVAGGQWINIPDTVTITGSSQLVTVKTAHSRLVIR